MNCTRENHRLYKGRGEIAIINSIPALQPIPTNSDWLKLDRIPKTFEIISAAELDISFIYLFIYSFETFQHTQIKSQYKKVFKT
jgi:hypothetical protein